ncbi:hypothetical protein B0T26DRAFT_633788 [Lasiosphaeria miniovina]|uniref:Small ribosomal subunit protein mS38 n=1 Tax=Lasiosphaeria miniovina TaxID=1954250 RepID=A0AA40BIW3_9PEZI|nr:uncharacterized protein B0T26DRAFT_633788 [Lasiosphaeria miniovina]KAK0735046.1 hypothetical protein B0T26DRAFT_633788 [Lasiosphaeria miniovina]
MLPSSVRRFASAAPQSPVISSLTSTIPRATATFGLSYKPNCHQRRYSSSKPSSPDDGSRDYASRPAVPASDGSKTTEEKRKRKTKASSTTPQLPSVPSTRHIKDESLALSTFFALHRPFSVTQLMPTAVTDAAFAEIFNQRSRTRRTADVIQTLDKTVQQLEQPLANLTISKDQHQHQHQQLQLQEEQQEAEDGATKIAFKRQDGSEASVYLQLNAMAGHFQPYYPPPAPEPVTDAQAEAEAAAAEEAAEQEPQTRIHRAIVTLEETLDADGEYKVVATGLEMINEDAQLRTFLGRVALRQLRYYSSRVQDGTMQAISVRRQRKLKMKKKKYKKLQRKTRNIRRKLDRL